MKNISKYLFPLLIILITAFIAVRNYTPGTYLSGWDTLHPEFNFGLNLQRLLTGVWREEQGLGTVAAHAHMSELPRLIVLWIMSLVLPVSMLRYAYIFLCFIAGPLGIYFFSKDFLQNKPYSLPAAFLGALFYIFNLGTVQHFYVPFEMFTVQYAFLGWLFLYATKFLQHRKKTDLIILGILSFASAPMAYASLLWYAYFLGLVIFLVTFVLLKKSKQFIKPALIILILTVVVNAFWLLPNWYFLATHAKDVPLAQSNILFTEEAISHNQQYGNLTDTAIFKNFLFDWSERDTNGLKVDLLASWKNHLQSSVSSLGYVFFCLVCAGVLISIFKKEKLNLALLPVGMMALVMIINMNPPFSYLFDRVRDNFPVFKEGLRFPYTKFSLLLMFAFSFYFAVFWFWLFNLVRYSFGRLILLIACSACLIIYGLPMFQGYLIDPHMRISIPQEYFDMFDWINKQPTTGRIAPLPMPSQFGWEYYDWGYQGAGFIWFGINKPVLARDFDRWNPVNEAYYREMSRAIYARDTASLEKLVQKYQIQYFLLDESIVTMDSKANVLFLNEIKTTLGRSQIIEPVQQFGSHLTLYHIVGADNVNNFVHVPISFTATSDMMPGGYQDKLYEDFGNYIMLDKASVSYPLRTLVNRYGLIDNRLVNISEDRVEITLPANTDGLTINPDSQTENILPDLVAEYSNNFTLENSVRLSHTSNQILFSYQAQPQIVEMINQPKHAQNCNSKAAKVSERIDQNGFITFKSMDGAVCDYVAFPEALHDFGGLFFVEARFVSGLPLKLCISKNNTRRCDILSAIEKKPGWQKYIYLLPPYPDGDSGYAVNFDNLSIGNTLTVNDIKNVTFIPLPYFKLAGLSFIDNNNLNYQNSLSLDQVSVISPLMYKINLTQKSNNQDGLVSLNQAYDRGWVAYKIKNQKSKIKNILGALFPYIFGEKLKNHVLVNNWANGWILAGPGINTNNPIEGSDGLLRTTPARRIGGNYELQTIYILFWPQVLEYIGLFALLAIITGLIIKKIIIR